MDARVSAGIFQDTVSVRIREPRTSGARKFEISRGIAITTTAPLGSSTPIKLSPSFGPWDPYVSANPVVVD